MNVRPRALSSVTTKVDLGDQILVLTVGLDDANQPYELFGMVQGGCVETKGRVELACRLVSLSLQQGASVYDVRKQCMGVVDMAPYQLTDRVVQGVGDIIAMVLEGFDEE